MREETPRAYRPKRDLIVEVAAIIEDDLFLKLSRAEFVAIVMRGTGGSARPDEVGALFDELVEEAGVPSKPS